MFFCQVSYFINSHSKHNFSANAAKRLHDDTDCRSISPSVYSTSRRALQQVFRWGVNPNQLGQFSANDGRAE